MKKVCLVLLAILSGVSSFSQVTQTKSDTLRKDALNVYMSATDYIRKEIPYVNYVRDIKVAGVYIISTSQGTGSGGYEFSYFFVGQNEYLGMSDTLTYTTSPDETADSRRQREVMTLKMGLMPYVARTPLSKYIRITFSEPLTETVTTDKWNNWVFTTSSSAYFNGQKTSKSKNINGRFTANRITKDWKIKFDFNYQYNINEYQIGTSSITSESTSKWANAMAVKSISDHWSYGGSVIIGSSSYSNLDMKYHIMPGLEYDVFPYSESTRRQFRILYKAGYNFVNYHDTTKYFKTEESLWLHTLTTSYTIIQKWGSVNASIEYSNYFHDWSKNNLDFYSSISMRVAKGLSVNLYGEYSIIHDQLGLPKGAATTEQVLLQRKELETQYSYYLSFGFSYTFGSIYNNVVNPRFGSGF